MGLWALAALVFNAVGGQSALVSYQQMQELKEAISWRIVEVEVVRHPEAGEDPEFIAPLAGQGVCIRWRDGSQRLLASQFLVENAAAIRVRTRQHPDWLTLKAVHSQPDLGIALVAGLPPGFCPDVPLAPGVAAAASFVAVTVDNPLQWANVFWAVVDSHAEPPLEEFLLSPVGLPLSYPLFTLDGALAGMNLRPYTPGSKLALAVSAVQLRHEWFLRAPLELDRARRRGISNPDSDNDSLLPWPDDELE